MTGVGMTRVHSFPECVAVGRPRGPDTRNRGLFVILRCDPDRQSLPWRQTPAQPQPPQDVSSSRPPLCSRQRPDRGSQAFRQIRQQYGELAMHKPAHRGHLESERPREPRESQRAHRTLRVYACRNGAFRSTVLSSVRMSETPVVRMHVEVLSCHDFSLSVVFSH